MPRSRGSSPGPARASESVSAPIAVPSMAMARSPDTIGIDAFPLLKIWMTARLSPALPSENYVYDFFRVDSFEKLYALLTEIKQYLTSGAFNYDITYFLNNITERTPDGQEHVFYLFHGTKIGANGSRLGDGFTVYETKEKKILYSFFEVFIRSPDKIEVISEYIKNMTICRSESFCTIAGGSRKRHSKKRRSKKRRALRKMK